MLEHRTIVPNCNFEKPNANIPLQDWKLKVPTVAEPWSVSGPRRASLNNFGFGGSNFHAILEDAEGYMAPRGLSGKHRKVHRAPRANGLHGTNGINATNGINGTNGIHGTNGNINGTNSTNGINRVRKMPKLFVLSAFHEAMGKQQVARLKSYLEHRLVEEHAGNQAVEDLSYTLADCRTHHPWRKAIIASTLEELHDALQPDSVKFSRSKEAVRLGFMFTGQGAHWHAMGRELMSQYPVFLESLQRSQTFLHAMGAPWSLIDELSRDKTPGSSWQCHGRMMSSRSCRGETTTTDSCTPMLRTCWLEALAAWARLRLSGWRLLVLKISYWHRGVAAAVRRSRT